jgi:hypothetical protein
MVTVEQLEEGLADITDPERTTSKSDGARQAAFPDADHSIQEREGATIIFFAVRVSLRAQKMPGAAIQAAPAAYNQSQCKPPVDERELEKILLPCSLGQTPYRSNRGRQGSPSRRDKWNAYLDGSSFAAGAYCRSSARQLR